MWLLLVWPLPLTAVFVRGLRTLLHWLVPAPAYRTSVLLSAGLTALVRPWLYEGRIAWFTSLLLAVAGAFAGGVFTTSLAIGLIEDNAPPSEGIREKVLTHHSSRNMRYPATPRLKRTLDLTLASFALVVTLPLWFLIAFAIWVEDPGPIFFTKNSVGLGGITFRQLKFRSMRYDAERTTGPIASSADDQRKLRCGRLLRRWHLDELPELVNVLNGTMSMVGPRPLRTVVVQRYLEELPAFAERHAVRPGMACIAQIEKYHMSAPERLRKDLVYIRKMSVGLDLRLLGRAVLSTVRGTRRDS